jgi:hypothetical protein
VATPGSGLSPVNQSISLTGPGINVYWAIVAFPPGQWTGSRSATLTFAPGSYRLVVDLGSYKDIYDSSRILNFNVQLAVPEPASFVGVIAAFMPWLLARRR